MARCHIVAILTGLVLTCINLIFWSQVVQIPSMDVQPIYSCDCSSAPSFPVAVSFTTPSTHTPSAVTISVKPELCHKLAVVVPFRDRFEEMLVFVPHIHAFLNRQNVTHEIWIINQVDKHRFNRAALLNIGFLLSRDKCDYLVMHDIDLLPLNDHLQYEYPSSGPLHISAPSLHPLYHYKTYVGGILIMSRAQFEQVNGLSNLFWGWGREDDELYTRMREKGMVVQYPKGITTGYQTFRHIHDRVKRPRDQKKYKNQWDMSRRIDRKTGFSNLKYHLVKKIELTIAGAKINFVNVEVHCDYAITPFCDNPT